MQGCHSQQGWAGFLTYIGHELHIFLMSVAIPFRLCGKAASSEYHLSKNRHLGSLSSLRSFIERDHLSATPSSDQELWYRILPPQQVPAQPPVMDQLRPAG